MGGAGTATVDGIDSLYVNPAGLNRNKGIVTTIMSPSITSNRTAYDALRDYDTLTEGMSLIHRPFVAGWASVPTNTLLVKDTMVRFKEIEDYSHYQTELNFDESV